MNASVSKPSDRLIPYFIVGFFLVLILVLVWFVMLALRNYPGEITTEAYNKGLAYNKTIENSDAQARLGWKSDLHFKLHGLEADTFFSLSDSHAKPITNAVVNAWFIRPVHAKDDQDKVLLTSDSKGHYTAKTTLPRPGEWEVHVSATYQGKNFQQVKNINLQ